MSLKNTDDDRAQLKGVHISRTLLTRFQVNRKNFHRKLLTQDETWVYHFERESKIENKQ